MGRPLAAKNAGVVGLDELIEREKEKERWQANKRAPQASSVGECPNRCKVQNRSSAGNVKLCKHEKTEFHGARAEIHSVEGEKERTDGRTNECVTRKNLWKIIEFSIAPRRESGRVREGARGRAIFLC